MFHRSIRRPLRPTPLTLALAAALPLLAPAAQAQAAAGEPAPASTTFELGTVQVTGRAIGPVNPRQLLTSVDVVAGTEVQNDSVRNTWELFRRVPGVLLTDFNQGTTSGKLSMRGFNGEGEVNAVKLLIDGVPSNSNDGNMPYLDLVFPLEIQQITTVRGTNDARFGLHSMAGNVDVGTRIGGNHLDARLGSSSNGLADVQLALGVEGEQLSQNYFIGVRQSDGPRDHSHAEKHSLAGKWFWQPADGAWRVGLVARHHQQVAEEPGYLTLADARATPTRSYDFSATDGGERDLTQISLHADGRLDRTVSWQAKVWRNTLDDRRWVRFSAGVAQQERVTRETHTGARTTLSWRPTVSGLASLTLEGGLDTERQDNVSERYETVERVRSKQTRDQAWTLDVNGAFVQAVVQPTANLRLVPGFRVDHLSGHFDNQLTDVRYAINDYGAISQPKISAVWTPLAGHSLYANWGRSFQVGVGAATYKVPPRTADLKPSINDGWEAGWRFQPAGGAWAGLSGRVAVWQQDASDEVRRKLNDPSGDSDNIGATRRRGLDVQLSARPAAGVEAWLAWTLQRARIVTPDPAAPLTQDKEVDHVPHHVYSAGVDWKPLPTWTFNASAHGQSGYFLERANTQGRWGAHTLLNLGATWQPQPAWSVSLTLKNLADRATEYVWWDGSQTLHAPGAGRSLHAALRAQW